MMTFSEKLSKLRKEYNYTQEQLADILEVSRQSVSKWESDIAYPETEKLIKISKLFNCTMDYLLNDKITEKNATQETSFSQKCTNAFKNVFKERKSNTTIFGMPLYHIGRNAHGFFAIGMKAKGIFAVGLLSKGIFSLGLLSLGILSIGILTLGLIAIGNFALGALAIGCIAVGVFAAGAISVGIISFGALSIGKFSAGAFAIGEYIAVGDHARAMLAIGESEAVGTIYSFVGKKSAANLTYVTTWLNENIPSWLGWAKFIFKLYLI